MHKFIEFRKEEIEQAITRRFDAQAARYSDRCAIKTRNSRFTYNQLREAANRVARAILKDRTGGPEPVALLMENGIPILMGIIGTLKAGKMYVPLDPSYPRERIDAMLQDSQTEIIVTNSANLALAKECSEGKRQILNVDGLDRELSAENLSLPLSPDSLAYILYTSGSTGEPKGVVQNHRNILYKTMRYTNDLQLTADDRIALLSPCTFSLSVGFIFGALLNGACLYPVDVKGQGLPQLSSWLSDERITVYNSVPTVFRHFVDTLPTEESFPELRLIHLGGEPVKAGDIELFKKHFSSECILLHHWGSNETGTIAQCFIDKQTPIHGNTAPAGRAAEESEVFVIGDDGTRLGFNRVGEIAVKSRFLAVEYWRKPHLTQSAFLPDPSDGEEKIYRTGDLGLIRPDGSIEHHGRKDFQIKIRGQKVELIEIESALVRHAAIKEAAVSALPDHSGDARLVAYVVPSESGELSNKELRQFLQGRLPEYMIPSVFVMLAALPVMPNGKLDRHALPAPSDERIDSADFVLPKGNVQYKLVQIWEKLLNVHPISIDDNFFDAGGNSLLLVKLHGELQESFGVDIPMVELFAYPTITAQAEYLCEMNKHGVEHESELPDHERDTQRQQQVRSLAQRRGRAY